MGLTNKTDTLDARGLAILLRNGTLPEVWMPPSELRDQRELLRLRIFLVRLRTRVKNRIHGTLSRHNVQVPGADLFGVAARLELGRRLPTNQTRQESSEGGGRRGATLGGCSLSRKFIASRKTRDWLFRRRTGKRGCQPSPREAE